jgi:hypothetical protein
LAMAFRRALSGRDSTVLMGTDSFWAEGGFGSWGDSVIV